MTLQQRIEGCQGRHARTKSGSIYSTFRTLRKTSFRSKTNLGNALSNNPQRSNSCHVRTFCRPRLHQCPSECRSRNYYEADRVEQTNHNICHQSAAKITTESRRTRRRHTCDVGVCNGAKLHLGTFDYRAVSLPYEKLEFQSARTPSRSMYRKASRAP